MTFLFPGLVYPDERDVRFLARSPSQARRGDGTWYGWDDRMLLREFRVLWDSRKGIGAGSITAPASFVFDGSSIPKRLRGMFSQNGSWARASIIHDWLYDQRMYSRAFADDLLEASLVLAGTPFFGRTLIMGAVRGFGGGAWEDGTPWSIS